MKKSCLTGEINSIFNVINIEVSVYYMKFLFSFYTFLSNLRQCMQLIFSLSEINSL